MLKKIFYFGIGLTSFFFEYFERLARTGEEKYNELVSADHPEEQIIAVETGIAVEADTQVAKTAVETRKPDDLTAINGIGPTFASRLQAAGITTYEALAALSEDQIREITHVAEWQADPQEWKASAAAMA
jgi:predicted flap endonuclease-1-like 5' DNA nuclease